jgi:hypothetical protein
VLQLPKRFVDALEVELTDHVSYKRQNQRAYGTHAQPVGTEDARHRSMGRCRPRRLAPWLVPCPQCRTALLYFASWLLEDRNPARRRLGWNPRSPKRRPAPQWPQAEAR